MLSCAYYANMKDMTSDQKIQNSLYLIEYNRKWDVGLSKLAQKFSQEIESDIAESKSVKDKIGVPISLHHHHQQQQHEKSQEAKEAKDYLSQICEAKDSYVDIKLIRDKKQLDDNDNNLRNYLSINAKLGVSRERLQQLLSFGIRRLVVIGREYANRKKFEDLTQKSEKKILNKVAHEQWIESKKLARKQLRHCDIEKDDEVHEKRNEKCANLLMSSRFQRKNKVKSSRNAAIPKLWFQRCIGDDDMSKITIHWSSLNELLESDFFIISMGKEDDEKNTTKVWRDPSKPGAEKCLMKEVHICNTSSYWISARIFTRYGASPEIRLSIPSKPSAPSAPILLKASDSSVKISWIPSSNTKLKKNDVFIVELCIDDEQDEWIGIWKGQHSVATLSGLNPDTGYKVRVRFRNAEGLSSSSGESSIVYTMLRKPQAPRLLEGGKDFIELYWDKPSMHSDNDRAYSLSPAKFFKSIDEQGKGWIYQKGLKDLLITLGVIESDDSIRILKDNLKHNHGKISFDQFLNWWNNHITFTIYQRRCGTDSEEQVVYKGTEQSVKLKASENTSYHFSIVCSTLRGSSIESKSICILTRPSCPKEIIAVHVDVDQIILKILFEKMDCKIRLEKMEIINDEASWSKVYEGSNQIVKITSLRSARTYLFRCQRVNREGRCSDFTLSEAYKTKNERFLLNTKSITDSFIIDCTNAITPGDLILFAEVAEVSLGEYQMSKGKYVCERCIIARVINIDVPTTRSEGLLHMEVVWVSQMKSKHKQKCLLKVGTMIKRSLIQICTFEVLRMPWINENKRI